MPVVGEIRTAKALGFNDHHTRVWVICPICNKGRWASRQNIRRIGYSGRCMPCYSNHPLWKSLSCP